MAATPIMHECDVTWQRPICI